MKCFYCEGTMPLPAAMAQVRDTTRNESVERIRDAMMYLGDDIETDYIIRLIVMTDEQMTEERKKWVIQRRVKA